MNPAVKAQHLHSPYVVQSLFQSGAMGDGVVPGWDEKSRGAYVERAAGGVYFGHVYSLNVMPAPQEEISNKL